LRIFPLIQQLTLSHFSYLRTALCLLIESLMSFSQIANELLPSVACDRLLGELIIL
jgi:hypothetical protein